MMISTQNRCQSHLHIGKRRTKGQGREEKKEKGGGLVGNDPVTSYTSWERKGP